MDKVNQWRPIVSHSAAAQASSANAKYLFASLPFIACIASSAASEYSSPVVASVTNQDEHIRATMSYHTYLHVEHPA